MRKILLLLVAALVVIFFSGCVRSAIEEESTTEPEPVSMVYKTEPYTEEESTTTEETTTEYIPKEVYEEEVEEYEPAEEDEAEPEVEDIEYEEDERDNDHGGYIGHFELTAYEWTGEPMANGEYPYYGACACNSLPIGTKVYISGHGVFVVKDRGRMADNVIDIYLGDPDVCWEFGRQEADVYYAD